MRTAKTEARAAVAEHVKESGQSMLTVSVRTTRQVPINTSEHGHTSFGELIDRHLAESAMNGDTVDGFELEIAPEQWAAWCARVQPQERDYSEDPR